MLGVPNFQNWRVRFSYVHQSSILQYSSTSSVPSRDSERDTVNGNKDKTEPMPNAMGNHPQNCTTRQSGTKAVGRVCWRSGVSAYLQGSLQPPAKRNVSDSRGFSRRIANGGAPLLKWGPSHNTMCALESSSFSVCPQQADLICSGLLTFPQHWV